MKNWNSCASFETERLRPYSSLWYCNLLHKGPVSFRRPMERPGENEGEETVGGSNWLDYEYASGKL